MALQVKNGANPHDGHKGQQEHQHRHLLEVSVLLDQLRRSEVEGSNSKQRGVNEHLISPYQGTWWKERTLFCGLRNNRSVGVVGHVTGHIANRSRTGDKNKREQFDSRSFQDLSPNEKMRDKRSTQRSPLT